MHELACDSCKGAGDASPHPQVVKTTSERGTNDMSATNKARIYAMVAVASFGGLVAALGAPLKW